MIYNYLKYKDYIRDKIQENRSVKGYQTKLAEAAGCQRPYISQVLNGHSDLSLEQAYALTQYWELNESESEYFLALVQHARAGTRALQELFKKKIQQYRRDQEDLAKRFNKPGVESIESQASYYSSWTWSAVHILLTIPHFDSVQKISQRLNISESECRMILFGLQGMGLIRKTKSGWKLTEMHIHIPKTSPFNSINHANWRNRALQDVMLNNEGTLHYSGVHSLSLEDYEKIKSICLKTIDNIHGVIHPSKEEELIFLGMDVFKV